MGEPQATVAEELRKILLIRGQQGQSRGRLENKERVYATVATTSDPAGGNIGIGGVHVAVRWECLTGEHVVENGFM